MKHNPLFGWIFGVIFIASLVVIAYSVIQIAGSGGQVSKSMAEWEQIERSMSQEDNLDLNSLTDGIDQSEIRKVNNKTKIRNEGPLYDDYPNRGEVIGKVIIPRLERELPIIHGTQDEELARGVGHYEGTVLPGENDNSVLAGHRDTVFRGLGEVGIGDMIIVETSAGKFRYEVYEERIVDADDRTVIVPYTEATLTLITCYPFNFVGAAPDRYILKAKIKD